MKLSSSVFPFKSPGFYSPVFRHVSRRQYSVVVHADIRVSLMKLFFWVSLFSLTELHV